MQDINLSELNQFSGTEGYTKVMGVLATDGVRYIMENGYAWLVTDAAAILTQNLKDEIFVAIRLKVNDGSAVVDYTDGNDKVLFQQKYPYSDAKKDLILYYTDDVIMLASEY